MTPAKLARATGCSDERARVYAPELDRAMSEFSIRKPLQRAHFIAQVAHESTGLADGRWQPFARLEENLNYRWDRLMEVWPKRFPNEHFARQFHRQPERIANWVYAERLGNGPPSTGEGWKFRGRGLIQLTGKYNYARCAGYLHLDIVSDPDLLLEPRNAARSAAWYWADARCNFLADADDIEAITKAINGGLTGLADRERLAGECKKEFVA